MPPMKAGTIITATVVIIHRKTKCRMAAWYSKFLSSRNRFAKSACNTGLVSRLALTWRQQHVARKSKIETKKQADSNEPEPARRNADGTTGTEPRGIAGTSKPKQKKTAPQKQRPRATRATDPKKAPQGTAISEPSDEEIRIRAYFIAERRVQLSLPGDSAHDWIEAKRQLVAESSSKVS